MNITHMSHRVAPHVGSDRFIADGVRLPKRVDVPTAMNTVFVEPAQVSAELRALAAAFPGAARVISAGRSHDGRDIPAIVLGTRTDDASVPRILVTGGVHGRETANAPLLMAWARDLLRRGAGTGTGPGIGIGTGTVDAARGALLANRTVVLVPQVNPDGAQEVAEGLRSGEQSRIWQRRNRAGVDLNRNFPGPTWGAGSGDPRNQNYRGPAPASEPETQAVLGLARDWAPAAVYDIHSPGGTILVPAAIPWPMSLEQARADVSDAALLANRASGYDIDSSAGMWKHETGGTLKDWAHDVLGVPALTIETGAVHHQTPLLVADSRARLFPMLDALVATVDGRHPAPSGAELLAAPPRADRFDIREHVQGVDVRWPSARRTELAVRTTTEFIRLN